MVFLRSFAAGLLLSAYFILNYGIEFSRWYGTNAPLFYFHAAAHAINPAFADTVGGNAYSTAIFLLLCIGAGLFIGGSSYFWIEQEVMRALDFLRRKAFAVPDCGHTSQKIND